MPGIFMGQGELASLISHAVSGGKALKGFLGMRRLQEITTKECEQLQSFVRKAYSQSKSRSGATLNRHIYLLSAVCSRAIAEERLNFNPCIRIKDEPR
jgi:hypothetical protein